MIPEVPILFRERDQLAVRPGAGRAAGIGQQHQRQQPSDLAIGREEPMHGPRQPDGLVRQIAAVQGCPDAAGVAFVENQIENVENGAQAPGALAFVGHAKRRTGRLDGLFRAADPLRHRRLRDQEGVGDLGGRQAADRAKRQRNRRRARERGVTAHEQQDEGVVLLAVAVASGFRMRGGRDRRLHDDHGLAPPPGELGAQVIGHAPRGDLDQPAARIVGHPLGGPLDGRGEQGFLNRIFRGREIAEAPDDRAENLRRKLAQQVLGGEGWRTRHPSTGGALITSRTSMGMFIGTPPLPGAAEARAAIA